MIPRSLLSPLLAGLAGLAAAIHCQCSRANANGTAAAPKASAAGEQDPAIPANQNLVRMMVSGNLLGRLEPCGCASGQLGGLARRWYQIGDRHDLLIEGGNLVAGATEIDVMKMFTTVEILLAMKRPYDVVGVGVHDLELPWADWAGFLSSYKAPIVASDLESTDPQWPGQPFVEKDVRGTKVRIASLAIELPKSLAKAEPPLVKLLEPAAAWQRALAGAATDTLRVVLVHSPAALARELAQKLQPSPDLVVCLDSGVSEPPGSAERQGQVPVVFPGIRGRLLLDLGLCRIDGKPRLTYEVVELRGSETKPGAQEDPDVKQILLRHRLQVKEDGTLAKMAEQLPTATGATYVGTENCITCHSTAYEVWEKTKHAKAWETLDIAEKDPKRYGWPVTHYPDCVSCHVVGYREKSGFRTYADTPGLAAVGCERCHGPGSAHVASGGTVKLGKTGGGLPATVCTQCHDFEQSPTFDYMQRWGMIKHGLEPGQGKK
jgi:hypothetical protein